MSDFIRCPKVSLLPVIALTSGEPAGIGPDLIALLATETFPAKIVVVGSRKVLQARARKLGIAFSLRDFASAPGPASNSVELIDVPLAHPVTAGELNPANARHVLELLEVATRGCLAGQFDAMVTAPVHKGVINDAGIAFTGHTEFLAQQSATARVVMMLVGGGLRVALATTHLPLSAVATAIDTHSLVETIVIIDRDLRMRFHIAAPRIAVTGLNPHAGEGGHLGREEIETIEPAIRQCRAIEIDADGPFPADTIFTPRQLKHFDCVLAMFHDQGLPVLKFASFGSGVNVTLGLPFIRTSVDHGTALALAGTGKIDSGSMRAAVELAIELTGK